MRTLLAFTFFLMSLGCGGRAIPVGMPLSSICDGLPTLANRHVAILLPGAGGSECVALVEENTSPTRSDPAAWVRREGTWSLSSLSNADGTAWQHAVVDGEVIVAVLDNVIESPGWELSLVASSDGGRTWVERSRIRKPYYFAIARTLSISNDQGAITVELEDDYGAGVAPGSYSYRTEDGGRTWSSARRIAAQR